MAKAYLVVKKVTVMPVAGEANTLYLLQDGTKLRLYLSNADGTAVNRIIDETDVNSLISTILGLISGQADGLATLDTNLKVVQTALKSDKWSSAITLLLKGDVGGSVSIDGSGNVQMFVQKSHSPTMTYTDGLLTRVDFSDSSFRTFTYTGGVLTSTSQTVAGRTFNTVISYDAGGNITSAIKTETTP